MVYEAGIGKESAWKCERLKGRERKAEKTVHVETVQYTVKKVSDFPVPSRHVTKLLLQCRLEYVGTENTVHLSSRNDFSQCL